MRVRTLAFVAFVVVLLACCSQEASAKHHHGPLNGTYGELALYTCVPSYQSAMQTLALWNDGINPDDKLVEKVRDACGSARNVMDVFIYAFPYVPLPTNASQEIALTLLNDFELGWMLIGFYKDLRGVNYSKTVRDQEMATIMQFMANKKAYNYDAFITTIDKSKIFIRPKSTLSDLFWGLSSAIPLANDTAIQNIALLLDGVWQHEYSTYQSIMALPNIWDSTQHDIFHTFRKIIRSALAVISRFPPVYNRLPSQDMDILDNAYGQFGALNDMITDYLFDVEHGNNDQAAQIKANGEVLWTQLKAYCATKNLPGVLKDLSTYLIPH